MMFTDLTDHQQQAITAMTRPLLGAEFYVEPVGGGRNSRVYRLQNTVGAAYALKVYFRQIGDPRDRLGTEYRSLSFLWECGLRSIPQPLSCDPAAGLALYEYIDGEKISPTQIATEHIEAAVNFAAQLQALAQHPGALDMNPASEAYFSIQVIYDNLQQRLRRLLDSQRDADPALGAFLQHEFIPALDKITRWSHAHSNWQHEIEPPQQILSPSDFGFHNALCRDHQMIFLDFEYFGWDIPAKLIADFLLHPAMNLSVSLRQHFVQKMFASSHEPDWLLDHVKSVYPFFGLKWSLICLNEFLPDDRRRRAFAIGSDQNWDAVRTEQLSKAKRILDRIIQEYEQFPYTT